MKSISKIVFKRTAVIFVLIALGTMIVVLFIRNTPSYPAFSYDSSQHEGWWDSGNMNLQQVAGANYDRGGEPKEKLPVADLTVHHGEKDQPAPVDNCFVIFSYYDFPLGLLESAYTDYENDKRGQGTLEILESVPAALETFEGQKSIELRKYIFSIKNQDVLSGFHVGFAEMNEGYLRIESVCKTTEDLKTTLPIIQSVRLNAP